MIADRLRGRAAIIKAWNDLPDAWRCHPALKQLHQAAQECEDVPSPAEAHDPTDPGRDVEVLREHVRHLERRVRELSQAQPKHTAEPVAWMIWTHGPVLVFMNVDEARLEFDRLNRQHPEPARKLLPLFFQAPAPGAVAWRPEVVAFADAMERKLRANDWKGTWKHDAPGALMDRVHEELTEFRDELFTRGPRDTDAHKVALLNEAADVANMLMMVVDTSGALPTPSPAVGAADAKDAARYRWLRKHNGLFYRTADGAQALRVALSHYDGRQELWVHCDAGLDAAVDAAMVAHPQVHHTGEQP